MAKLKGLSSGPRLSGPMAGLTDVVRRTSAAVPLDEMDLQILRVLRRDARVSQRQLAREVGMSAPAVGERIARLEKSGVIRGYTIDVEWGALGLPVLVYLPMTIAPGADLADLMNELRAIPEIDELTVVTGAYDLIARLRLRDHTHLQEVLLERLWPVRGLQRVETFLSLGEVPTQGILTHLLHEDGDGEADAD
ncbi:MAG TPA: Lrp/AsnC family transcriptional regulator [Gryllotalpicola sp.]